MLNNNTCVGDRMTIKVTEEEEEEWNKRQNERAEAKDFSETLLLKLDNDCFCGAYDGKASVDKCHH